MPISPNLHFLRLVFVIFLGTTIEVIRRNRHSWNPMLLTYDEDGGEFQKSDKLEAKFLELSRSCFEDPLHVSAK